MVPSWTETLIRSGVDVIGRTRYCIHPENKIKIVGGTKDWNIDLVRSLNPDFILLDREENPKEMYEAWPEKCVITHVEKVTGVSQELSKLAIQFQNASLADLAERWKKLSSPQVIMRELTELPGVLHWIKEPKDEIEHLIYVIWKNPWMAVNRDTFIASVLTHLGFGTKLISFPKKYSEFKMEELPPKTLLLFSSEPYPFLKRQEGLSDFGAASAIVNGEDYSWFGVRSLEFLERNTTPRL